MACSICNDPQHNKKTCTNHREAFIKKHDGWWGEFNDNLKAYVKELQNPQEQAPNKPEEIQDWLWTFYLSQAMSLWSYSDILSQKVLYGLELTPLEAAVWRYATFKDQFHKVMPHHKGYIKNTITTFYETASQPEIQAYEDLLAAAWNQVIKEANIA